MNREQLNSNFFPQDLMLKLFSDISDSDVETKINLINDYIDEVRDSYDEDVLKIQQHNLTAFCYWMAEQYPQAINHYEKVMGILKPEDSPQIYFLSINSLIKANRLLSNNNKALQWAVLALENNSLANAVSNLHNLNEYVGVIVETGSNFDEKYIPLIQSIIDEYGFPEELKDPVDTIKSMNKTHSYWAKKLTYLDANFIKPNMALMIAEYKEYIESCEIDWYRNYAINAVEKMKQKK